VSFPLPHLLRWATGLLLAVTALSATAQQLTVSAAASLTDALREIGTKFEAARPGVTLRLNFAASGTLLQQIVQGAPVDAFVSADEETVSRGIELKVLDATSRRSIASNQLVLIRPMAGPDLRGLSDLTGPQVRRVAVVKPATSPAGRYAQQALTAVQLWDALHPRLIPADTVRQVLDYVARGEVEAGFVFRTDAALMPERVRVVMQVDGHAPIRYPAVLVSDGKLKALAADFIAFLGSPAAQEVLARRGFGAP
jgi:molybdate transport system substrate-binding protein